MKTLLNGRSHFSLGESLLTPTQIVEQAVSAGATSVALTDTMRISGMAEFFTAAKKHSIKTIIGARLRIVDELFMDREGKKKHRPYYLRVLIQNEAGYQALLNLLSLSFDETHFYEMPRLLLTDVARVLRQAGDDACLVTLGDFYGAHSAGKAKEVVFLLRASYVSVASEIVPIDTPHFVRLAHDAFQLEQDEGVPVIIARPSFYTIADDADSLDLLRAIASNLKLDARSTRHVYREFTTQDRVSYGKALLGMATTMNDRYPGTDWAMSLIKASKYTDAFPETVSYRWEKSKPSLPVMAADEFSAVKEACLLGWKERFSAPVFGHIPTDLTIYAERLKYELNVLRDLKFESYFLLVAEIVTWSKSQGIRVGPGRGCFVPGSRVMLSATMMKAIEDVQVGDQVLAHDGSTQQVIATLAYDCDEDLIELEFDNGVIIRCTKDHEFFTANAGWKRADEISGSDELEDVREHNSTGVEHSSPETPV